MNMNNILRRLRLDFTDIYKAGVSFDEIAGGVVIADGQLTIKDYLNIESPSSRFRIMGSTSLSSQELDMNLVATLPVGKNLPWIAALMGGLPTAAIVYGASKIFESQVDDLSSAVYTLEGNWDEPQLELKRVFDVKSRKNNVVLPEQEAANDSSIAAESEQTLSKEAGQ